MTASALLAPAAALGAADSIVPTGGVKLPGVPHISAASCANQRPWTCARGQVVTLAGDEMQGVTRVIFLGRPGRRDDVPVTIKARAAQAGQLLVVVPRRARSGRVRAINAIGRPALSTTALEVLAELPAIDDAGRLNKLFAGGRRTARFRYLLTGSAPADAAVEAVRMPDGTVVRSWPLRSDARDPGAGAVELSWDGFVGPRPVATGTYLMRLNAAAAAVATVDAESDTQFDIVEALFPIRGEHQLGRSAVQRFGGARGHKGHDAFARCGTPLAALTKGTVQFAGYHGAAGNYVVVHEPGGESYVYMHLRDATTVERGDPVFTGERLGYVGDTGDAQGCHLHIELWSAPGWYEGGHPYDPITSLARWDGWS